MQQQTLVGHGEHGYRVTMSRSLDAPANALHIACNASYTQVAVAGRSIFKIFDILDEGMHGGPAFLESNNLRNAKGINLNYSCHDVVWSRIDNNLLATAATNGAVVIWNLGKSPKQPQTYIFSDHQRIVNKVNFHRTDPSLLISGSQDGTMTLFDLRMKQSASRMVFSRTESVRDVAWNPHAFHQLSAVSENGQVQVWDIRRPEAAEKKWAAHTDHIYTCEWHPEIPSLLATAGRDRTIKVWNVESKRPIVQHTIYTIDSIAKIHWRPEKKHQIASVSLISDVNIHVWDCRRPHVPFVSFVSHTDIPTSFLWRGDPHTILSAGKDSQLYQHSFVDGVKLTENANPMGLSFNIEGDLMYSFRLGNQKLNRNHSDDDFDGGIYMGSPLDKRNTSSLPRSLSSRKKRFSDQGNQYYNRSDLLHIRSHTTGLEANIDDEDDELHFLTDQRYIRYMAQNYRYTGMSFVSLCDYNATVAKNLGRNQLVHSWLLVKSLYMSHEEIETALEEGGKLQTEGEENPDQKNNCDQCEDQKTIVGKSLRTLSPKVPSDIAVVGLKSNSKQNQDGENPNASLGDTADGKRNTTSSKADSPSMSGDRRKLCNKNVLPCEVANDSGGGCDYSDDDDEYNDDTLTNIASGQMLAGQRNDFFGDMENSMYYGIDLLSSNEYSRPEPDFNNLPIEAFEYRRDIPDDAAAESGNWHVDDQHQVAQRVSTATEESSVLQTTVTVIDNPMNTLYVNVNGFGSSDEWNPNSTFLDLLEFYANLNDTQTSVSMYLVVGERTKNRRLVSKKVLSHWFMSYLFLLNQLCLYQEANLLMSLCHLRKVHAITTGLTHVTLNCGRCLRRVNIPGWRWCRKCKDIINTCAICNKVVRGLYSWCQGCGHGGHIDHITEWYEKNVNCPAGCGHRCEYE